MKKVLFLIMFCLPIIGAVHQNISVVKSVGFNTAVSILQCKGLYEYPGEWHGVSAGWGASSDSVALHPREGESTTAADAMLVAIALPTVTSSSLDITVDVGTYLVADVTAIVADGSELKTVRVDIELDSSGDPVVVVYEKTTGEYAIGPQSGNSLCAQNLKQYTVPASGSTLTEASNGIF